MRYIMYTAIEKFENDLKHFNQADYGTIEHCSTRKDEGLIDLVRERACQFRDKINFDDVLRKDYDRVLALAIISDLIITTVEYDTERGICNIDESHPLNKVVEIYCDKIEGNDTKTFENLMALIEAFECIQVPQQQQAMVNVNIISTIKWLCNVKGTDTFTIKTVNALLKVHFN